MDPAGVQAARQSSIGEKKRRIRSPTEQQQTAPARVCTCITMCGNQRLKESYCLALLVIGLDGLQLSE